MAVPARLSVVTIGVRDLPLLRRFYRALGWAEVAGSDDEWVAYLVGGVLFALYPEGALAAEAGAAVGAGAGAGAGVGAEAGAAGAAAGAGVGLRAGWSGVTLACNVDSPEEVDAAVGAAVDAGATLIAPPVTREWGGRSGYIADPEGNRWEIAWAPTARFDERGALIAFGT